MIYGDFFVAAVVVGVYTFAAVCAKIAKLTFSLCVLCVCVRVVWEFISLSLCRQSVSSLFIHFHALRGKCSLNDTDHAEFSSLISDSRGIFAINLHSFTFFVSVYSRVEPWRVAGNYDNFIFNCLLSMGTIGHRIFGNKITETNDRTQIWMNKSRFSHKKNRIQV